MEGIEFLQFAAFLAAQNRDEVARRTAVSRAYYGAFHLAREFLEEVGVRVPANATGHGFILLRLENCGHADAREAGSLLSDIRSERNRADYDLSDRRFERIENVRAVIETASEIQRLLLTFRSEPTRTSIRDGITRYHQQVRYTG
jgi:hypothetical protein